MGSYCSYLDISALGRQVTLGGLARGVHAANSARTETTLGDDRCDDPTLDDIASVLSVWCASF